MIGFQKSSDFQSNNCMKTHTTEHFIVHRKYIGE